MYFFKEIVKILTVQGEYTAKFEYFFVKKIHVTQTSSVYSTKFLRRSSSQWSLKPVYNDIYR